MLHTHSVANTVLSRRHLPQGGIALQGYEMLKGLPGIDDHATRLWLPILPNSQDMPAFSREVASLLDADADVPGFLIAGHGLYTWGDSLADAQRHVEVLEFMLACELEQNRGT